MQQRTKVQANELTRTCQLLIITQKRNNEKDYYNRTTRCSSNRCNICFIIMRIEKLFAYIFLTFILMVACFNIIGSLSMLIIDKKNDVITLRNLGATDGQIRRIFLFEGRMISIAGAIIGIALGLLLCWLQQTYGLVQLGDQAGNFVVNAYPISVHPEDIIVIFITVILVGWLSVWYPVRYMSRKFTKE